MTGRQCPIVSGSLKVYSTFGRIAAHRLGWSSTMASALASSSCSTRACQRAGSVRRSVQPVTTAVPRPAARQQQLLTVQLQAAAQDEIIDLETVQLQGATAADVAAESSQEWSMAELVEAAEATHLANLAVADVEAAFLEGTADQDVASYLSGLQSEAEGLLLGGKGAAAEAATAAVAAAAAEMEEAGDVPDAPVVAELGRRPLNYGPKDVLEGMANEEAIAARRVVKGLKLSREELGQELLPEDWDQTTVEWFSDSKETDIALPEYKLTFLWLDKTLACAVDQVFARGNSAPLTQYFIWPRADAWEEMKISLESRPWVDDADKVSLLNRLTAVINFWTGVQEYDANGQPLAESKPPTIEEARAEFPDCVFMGA